MTLFSFNLGIVAVLQLQFCSVQSSLIFPAMKRRLELQRLATKQAKTQPELDSGSSSNSTSTDTNLDMSEVTSNEHSAVSVPMPMDMGAEGFPQLPPVEQIMSAASGTVRSVSDRTGALQAQLMQAQAASEGKLTKQKALFETKLQTQEQYNREIVANNAKLSTDIGRLQGHNKALKNHAHALEVSNKASAAELQVLQEKLDIARGFTSKSLQFADASRQKVLGLIQSQAGKQETRIDSVYHPGTSLLLLSHSRSVETGDSDATTLDGKADDLNDAALHAASPTSILDSLSKEVEHLAQQEKQSEATLKHKFVQDFHAGEHRRAALIAQQKDLTAKKGVLSKHHAELQAAVDHLKKTRLQLERDLHSIGHFLSKLAHFALASKRDVPRFLAKLPTSISSKEEM